MPAELIKLIQQFGQPHILVLGDVMLDRYIWGDAARVSQEAPVILLRADKKEERLGGAASVATLLRALGAQVSTSAVVGADADGQRLRGMLTELGIDHDGVLTDSSRITTVKERYIGRAQHRHPQQMLRVDYETTTPINESLQQRLIELQSHQLKRADIVLVSDYDKGVCTEYVLRSLIEAAKANRIPVLIDPARNADYQKYAGCTAITPNRLEAAIATGCTRLNERDEILAAAKHLRNQLDLETAIITLDKDGMAYARRNEEPAIIPTRSRQVYDITGAGDMVLAMMGMALAAGGQWEQAIRLANVAGGLEVERIGVAPITRDEILRDLLQSGTPDELTPNTPRSKAVAQDVLCQQLQIRRQLGQRIAFTNGCFDILHAGHVEYLQLARAQADLLIVGLNSDDSVRRLKGDGRPINPLEARLQVIGGLECVDYVIVFEQDTPMELIKAIRPDVLVKGADYRKEDVVGADFVQSYGGRVYLAPLRQGYSTTCLLDKVRAA